MNFGENLKYYMQLNGINQSELGRILGVNRATVSYWVSGTMTPIYKKVEQMCEVFNCDPNDLMRGHKTSVPKELAETISALNAENIKLLTTIAKKLKESQ